jgi:xylulokinase
MGRPWILAVDLGSGGPKVGVVGLDGEIIATAFVPVPTEHTADGGSEQDVQRWWDGIRSSIHEFLGSGVVSGNDLHGVGLTSQWSSIVPVDVAGDPVGACLMWSDHRGARHAREAVGGPVAGLSPAVLARSIFYTGTVPLTTGEDQLGHELHLRHDQPERYRRTRLLLEPVDYLGLRLTGIAAATPASMFFSSLVDNRPRRPVRYVDSQVRRLRRNPQLLPPLRRTGSLLGPVRSDVAAELGIRAGAPVVCGVPDFFAAYLGSGAVEEYHAHLAISTTSWLTCRVPFKRVDPFRVMASVPGVAPGSYLVINDQASAGYALYWWTRQLEIGYPEAVEIAGRASPGAGGTIFLPWLRGEHTPVDHRHSRAGFVNMSASTSRSDLTRAVLEGVALNGRWLLQAVEGFVRRPVASLRVLGGGAQADLWCQIYADVLGRPVERVRDPMFAQLRGAALLARIGLGEITLAQATQMVPVADRFEPDPGSAAVYDPLFAEFTGLFRSLKPHHSRLNG